MKQPQPKQVMVGILLVLAVLAAVYISSANQKDAKPPPSAGGYYTGPMKNKWGTITTEEGKLVQPTNGGDAPTSSAYKDEQKRSTD
jgi:hypothetical protein